MKSHLITEQEFRKLPSLILIDFKISSAVVPPAPVPGWGEIKVNVGDAVTYASPPCLDSRTLGLVTAIYWHMAPASRLPLYDETGGLLYDPYYVATAEILWCDGRDSFSSHNVLDIVSRPRYEEENTYLCGGIDT